MIDVIQDDCLKAMREFPDKSFDLLLTDPPYGIGEDGGDKSRFGGKSAARGFKSCKNYPKENWDSSTPSKEYFDEMLRVSKKQIIWGGNYFASCLPDSSCWLVWDKKETAINDFADCELAWTSFKSAVRKFTYGWTGFEGINNLHKTKETREHPTQKPTPLMQWCLEKYSKEGDKILDPFAGSGTTGVACHNLKRDCVLIEREPKYVEIIKKRLAELPPTLF